MINNHLLQLLYLEGASIAFTSSSSFKKSGLVWCVLQCPFSDDWLTDCDLVSLCFNTLVSLLTIVLVRYINILTSRPIDLCARTHTPSHSHTPIQQLLEALNFRLGAPVVPDRKWASMMMMRAMFFASNFLSHLRALKLWIISPTSMTSPKSLVF